MCLYPKIIRNRKYTPNKKNGGVIPAVIDQRVLHVSVGCGKCIECMNQKSREWQTRLHEDIQEYKEGRFITLTFSNEAIRHINSQIPYKRIRQYYKQGVKTEKELIIEGYARDNAIATYAVRHFLERWRKKYKRSLRHWLVTELGQNGTENIHLHGIIWQPDYYVGDWLEFMHEIENIWGYGWVWKYKLERGRKINYVSERTVNYCVKYVNKVDEKHRGYKPLILTSPGIGAFYTKKETGDWKRNRYKPNETDEAYRLKSGHKIGLPVYYRNKIYSEQEKELLWLEKLDKNERWVCGEKIDVSQSMKGYYALLEFHRKRNDELGYGNDKLNWSREKYENERRKIMLLKREGADYPREWDAFN